MTTRPPIDGGPGEAAARPAAAERSLLRSVAVPSEHGGWGLTVEPVVLGLLVRPGVAGAALGVAAVLAFLARTPLKLALVDRRRHRRLERTRLAERVAVAEIVPLVALVVFAAARSHPSFWIPLAAAAPLVAVQLWFDMASRSRRLLPELAGSIGIGAVAASIVLAGGGSGRLAMGTWAILGARAVASIPFVRLQITRFRHHPASVEADDWSQTAAVCLASAAVLLDRRLVLGAFAVVALCIFHGAAARRPVPRPKIIGFQQLFLGLALTLLTALGTHL